MPNLGLILIVNATKLRESVSDKFAREESILPLVSMDHPQHEYQGSPEDSLLDQAQVLR